LGALLQTKRNGTQNKNPRPRCFCTGRFLELIMKIKTSELTGLALDWAVANPGKVSRYMSVMERIHRQSSPRPNGCRIWTGRTFDYRDWNVIGPIAERYDAFPRKLASMEGWWADVFGKNAKFADTPQKAIAMAVIEANK
jgi:hypothetical protein